MSSHHRHIPALTGIRFVAAFHVVIYHLWRYDVWRIPEPLLRIVKAGPASVTLFFVLSGYLLTLRYRVRMDEAPCAIPTPFALKSYLRARFARVYPVHLLGWCLALPVAWVMWQRDHAGLEATRIDFWASGIWVLSMMQAWHPANALAWNPPAWSLSVEVFYYLLFPWLLSKLHFVTKHRLYLATFFLWALALGISAMLAWISSQSTEPVQQQMWVHVLKFNPLVRLPEFVLGMMLAEWVRVMPSNAWRAFGWRIGAGALIVVAWSGAVPYALWHNAWLVPTWMWLLGYLSAQPDTLLSQLLSHPLLERLGEASYALYILHVPVLYWVAGFGQKRFGTPILERPWVALLCLIALMIMSLVVYRVWESPCRKWLRGIPGPTR